MDENSYLYLPPSLSLSHSHKLVFFFQGLKEFLNYTTFADKFEGDEYSKMEKNSIDEAIKLGRKKSYKKAFNTMTVSGISILNSAIMQVLKLLPRLLLDYLDVDPSSTINDHTGRMSLHYVCQTGDMFLLKHFLKKHQYNFDFNGRDTTGLTPLHIVVLYDQTKAAYKMVKRVTELETHDMFFGRSLHLAAYMKQISVVKRITEKFPQEVLVVTSGFCTPHLCALFGGSTECLEYLWELSPLMADKIVSKAVIYTESQETALHNVTFLIGHGANPDGFDKDLWEEHAVIVAAKKRWTDVLNFLVQRTTAIDGVPWTVDGVLEYVAAPAFMMLDAQRTSNKVQTLRERMIQELNNMNVMAALIICESMKSDLNETLYRRLHSLCEFFWEMTKISAVTRMEASFENLRRHAWSLWERDSYGLAVLALAGCLAFDPNDVASLYLHDKIVEYYMGLGDA